MEKLKGNLLLKLLEIQNDKKPKWHMADFSHQLYLSLKKYQYDEYTPINSDFFFLQKKIALSYYFIPLRLQFISPFK